jgi:predicted ester cyclase
VVIPADATIGEYTVTVDGLTTSFTVNEYVAPLVASLTSISPDNADQGQTLDVTITGENTNFSNATIVSFTNDLSETLTSTITVVDENTLTANVVIPADATIGQYTVTVSSSDYDLTTTFSVNEVVTPEPILTSISPDNANQGETIDVTITGENTNFSNATAVSFTNDLSETLTSTITVVDVNTLTANVTIPADATIGNYTVTVDGLTTSFTVNETTASYLWSDNFSDTTKWTIANSTDDQQNWVITNISDAGVGYGTGTWEDADFVTSANNGYALFDSDIIGATGGFQDATITLNEELNFMDNDYVVLEFNNRGRMWQTTQNFVEVCNSDCDADSAEWVAYEVNAEETTSQLFENVKQVNISPTAGSQSNVKIRFRYVGSWDYAWMVDEPRIVELVPNEIVAQSAWIFEENSGGVEFGRTPISQVGNSFEIGGSVFNFGAEDQTNVTLDVNFTGPSTITASESVDLLETDSTHTYSIMSSLDLEVGLYEGVYNFSSDNDASGDNNVLKRNFEITNNVYSLDGIGIHPEEALTISSLGTASFQDASDLVCATMYSFNNNDTISSITAELGTTLANAEIIAYVIDSTNFFDGNFGEAISMSDLYVVTEDDVASGSVQIPVLGNANDGTLEYLPINPGKYYVALELFSAGNTYDIRILDDETVGQPWDYSMIYIAGAQAYSNGNAFAIRVITGNPDALGIEENFENFSMYPNPSSGTVFFNFEKNQERVLTVRDISGKVILSKVTSSNTEIDFNNYGKGIYLVNIQSENGSITEKVIIQ